MFKKVFESSATQQEVFEKVAAPLVHDFMDGYNRTIFAYGQTGSGKTFTMSGNGPSYDQRGIIPRVFKQLFRGIKQRKDLVQYVVSASYLEIYNECGYDLLNSKHAITDFEKLSKISLFEDKNERLNLKNLSVHTINTDEQAL